MKIKVTCVDDLKRPAEIPADKWVTLGQPFHVTHVYRMMRMINNEGVPTGIMGVSIAEINLDNIPNCPYNCFNISRFLFNEKDIPVLEELISNCAELNEFDITELIEEQVLVER